MCVCDALDGAATQDAAKVERSGAPASHKILRYKRSRRSLEPHMLCRKRIVLETATRPGVVRSNPERIGTGMVEEWNDVFAAEPCGEEQVIPLAHYSFDCGVDEDWKRESGQLQEIAKRLAKPAPGPDASTDNIDTFFHDDFEQYVEFLERDYNERQVAHPSSSA